MKAIALMVMLFLATPVFAAELTEGDVKAFLSEWLEVQNSGSFSRYAEMYSKEFTGIKRAGINAYKLDYDGWLKDRSKMFKKKIVVQADNFQITVSGPKAIVKFTQTFQSECFKDKGRKIVTVLVESQHLKIVNEEMVSSETLKSKCSTWEGHLGNVAVLSKFTPVASNKCSKMPGQLSKEFEKLGLYGDECPAPAGWRLFVIVGGDRSWIDIARNGLIWTSEQEVMYKDENQFGYFPNVTDKSVEWITTSQGIALSLIFPITAQDPKQVQNNLKRYFVINLRGPTPSFCGTAMTANEARIVARVPKNCNTSLPARSFTIGKPSPKK